MKIARLLIFGRKKMVVVGFINIYTYYLYIRINIIENNEVIIIGWVLIYIQSKIVNV